LNGRGLSRIEDADSNEREDFGTEKIRKTQRRLGSARRVHLPGGERDRGAHQQGDSQAAQHNALFGVAEKVLFFLFSSPVLVHFKPREGDSPREYETGQQQEEHGPLSRAPPARQPISPSKSAMGSRLTVNESACYELSSR